jgi:hypothetical protein
MFLFINLIDTHVFNEETKSRIHTTVSAVTKHFESEQMFNTELVYSAVTGCNIHLFTDVVSLLHVLLFNSQTLIVACDE